MTQEKDREAFKVWWEREAVPRIENDDGKLLEIMYIQIFAKDAWLNGACVAEERYKSKVKTDWEEGFKRLKGTIDEINK